MEVLRTGHRYFPHCTSRSGPCLLNGWAGARLREVQEQAYTAVSGGNDVLVIAPTAGGKSEAALIPVLDDILKSGTKGVACLYLSPLKALINDQEERIAAFCRPTGLSVAKWHGDVPKGDRGWKSGEAPQFLLITPESLEVLLHEKGHGADLANLKYVIVDELHAFVESERGVHVKILLDRLDRIARDPVQRIGLSATVGNPDEILMWLSSGRHPRRLVAVPAPATAKKFRFVIEPDPPAGFDALAGLVAGKKALVFVNSRSAAETIVQEAAGRIKTCTSTTRQSRPPRKRRPRRRSTAGKGPVSSARARSNSESISGTWISWRRSARRTRSLRSYSGWAGAAGGNRPRLSRGSSLTPGTPHDCALIECAREKRVEPLLPPEKPYNVLVQQIFLFVHSVSRAGRARSSATSLRSPHLLTSPRGTWIASSITWSRPGTYR